MHIKITQDHERSWGTISSRLFVWIVFVFVFFMVWTEIVLLIVNNGRRIQSAAPCETISFFSTWSSECWQEGSIQREGHLYCNCACYFSGLQSAPSLWHTLYNWRGSFLLDACHSCLKPWYSHGTWNYSNCDFWNGDAIVSWIKNHSSGQQCSGGPSTPVSLFLRFLFL